jgi:Rieske Fe-S protein
MIGVAVVAAGSVTAVLIMSGSDGQQHLATIQVGVVARGKVTTTRYTVAAGGLRHAPVFVARETDGRLVAFLGRSTHLGCEVVLANDPRWPRFRQPPNVAFEDPCGGSTWALNGDCFAGPCPRGLSTFPLKVTGSTAQIDLSRTIPGRPRPPA